MICRDCGTEHPEDQVANPHYCTARLSEQNEKAEEWRREWQLLNAANLRAEERIGELESALKEERNRSVLTAAVIRENEHLTKENMRLEADCDGYRNGQDQLQDMLNVVMDSNAKLAAENKRLRAALGSTTDDDRPICASLDTTGCLLP